MMSARTIFGCTASICLLAGCGGSGYGGGQDAGGPAAPAVKSVSPAGGSSGIALNTGLAIVFSEAMDPATITSSTFTLAGPASAAVGGTVTYAGETAFFRPAANLSASTIYTATLSTGAKSAAGMALAAVYTWQITTGAAADTTAPTVTSTSPVQGATGVVTNAGITATFSEAMAPLSFGATSFTLSAAGSAISGAVTYDVATRTATLQPGTALLANTAYSATLHGVTDLAGNALASDDVWTFTSGAHTGLTPVLLGSSINYVLVAKTAVSTVPTSAVTGDLALSPAAASYITGFGLTAATGYSTSPQVTGKIYAADYAPPTPSTLTTAVADMQTGYTDAAGRPTPDFLEFHTGAIGGLDLVPGLYKWTNTVTITSDVTLTGGATDVWIFQIAGDLTMSASQHVILAGNALAKNVFWQVAGAVNVGAGAHFEGIILSQTSITLQSGASMNGRALAQSAVSLAATTLTQPAL